MASVAPLTQTTFSRNWRGKHPEQYFVGWNEAEDGPRFLQKFVQGGDEECWLWNAAKDRDGYGFFKVKRKMYKAHRVMFALAFGWLPQRPFFICHKCDTPSCVNPRHLWAGRPSENSEDMVIKGRSARGDRASRSRLSRDQVIAIKQRLLEGDRYRTLARDFNVSDTAIRFIAQGKNWRHITLEEVV